MDSFFVRFKNSLVLITVVLAQMIALAVQVQRPGHGNEVDGAARKQPTLLRYWAVGLVSPFEKVTHWASFDVRRVWGSYAGLRHTREQNQALLLEIARLRQEQTEFAEDAAEGRRLQSLLAFKQQYVATTVAAQVIGTSGSDRSRVLTLDKGAADGLKPEQPVMTPDGVVGKLIYVFPHTAQLLLLNDPTSGAGVVLESTRIRAIVRGTPTGKVVIDNLTADSRIQPGEKVLTSGGDMVFPRGLPVGVIEAVAPDPQHQPYTAITIAPAANLMQLEEVLVITGTTTDLPAAAQQDAATAEAAVAANKRAADLIADKLPAVKQEPPAGPLGASGASGPGGELDKGGVPGVPNSGLPKVVPPVHPDKYSPGSTLPATDLKPGGPE